MIENEIIELDIFADEHDLGYIIEDEDYDGCEVITLTTCPNCGVQHDEYCADCPCGGYDRFEESGIGDLPL